MVIFTPKAAGVKRMDPPVEFVAVISVNEKFIIVSLLNVDAVINFALATNPFPFTPGAEVFVTAISTVCASTFWKKVNGLVPKKSIAAALPSTYVHKLLSLFILNDTP
jgi:hypothetical protein